MPNPAARPRRNSPTLEGTKRTSVMIGPSFSVAMEKRSSVSRAPVRSSELTRVRQRSQRNARKVRSIAGSEPVEIRRRPLAADEIDEQLFEILRSAGTGADLGQRPLGHEPPTRDDADVRGEPLHDLEDVRRQEHGAAA